MANLPSWRDDPRANDPTMSFSMEKGWEKILPSWRDDPRANDPTLTFSMERGWETATPGILAARLKGEQDAMLARQNAEQEGLFKNYESIRKNQEALPNLYNRLQTEAGIPELSGAAQGFKNEIYRVKDKLDRLGEDVLARTTGYNVSDAQRRRLETAEAEPLQTNLGRLGTGLAPIADMLQSATSGVATQMQLQTQQQERELEPVKLRINAVSDKFAREMTGFTADRELQLTALLDKLERDRFLADRDWELAQQLAAEERDFSRNKEIAKIQLGASNIGGGSTAGNTSTTTDTKPKASYTDWANVSSKPLDTGLTWLNSTGLTKPIQVSSTPTPAPAVTAPKNNNGLTIAGKPFSLFK